MKAPIPSPVPEPVKVRPVTGRIEWDEEEQCLVLTYTACSFRTLLYGECFVALRRPILLGAVPFTCLFWICVALYTRLISRSPRYYFQMFSWGVRDSAVVSLSYNWAQCKKFYKTKRALFVFLSFWKNVNFLPREHFVDQAEYDRCAHLVKLLIDSKGANWEEVAKQYKYSNTISNQS